MEAFIIEVDVDQLHHDSSGKKNQVTVVSISPEIVNCLDESVALPLQNVLFAHTVEDQVVAMKKVANSFLNSCSEQGIPVANYNAYAKLAVELYILAPLKHPLKKAISKILNSLAVDKIPLFEEMLCEGLKNHMNMSLSTKNLSDLSSSISALLSVLEHLHFGVSSVNSILGDVLTFLEKALKMCCNSISVFKSPVLKLEVSKLTHSTLRVVIVLLQKVSVFSSKIEIKECQFGPMPSILECANFLMNCYDLPFDTRSVSGLVIIIILDLIHGQQGWIELLSSEGLTSTDSVQITDVVSCISICLGSLSGLKLQQLEYLHPNLNKTIFCCLFDVTLHLNFIGIQESNVILGVWRLVHQLTRTLNVHPVLVSSLTALQFESLIKYVWSQLDHYMDAVKHLARSVLDNLLQLRDFLLSIGFDLSKKMNEAVTQLPKTKRGRYVILDVMASHLGADQIINILPNLVEILLFSMCCSSASSYALSAFTSIVATHFNEVPQSSWINTWVMPLLELMQNNEVRELLVLEDALTKIIHLCPAVVDEVLRCVPWENSHSHNNLKTLLTCLKISRKLGLLSLQPDKESEMLWHGIIPYIKLQSALVHQSDEVRLLGVALIVDTNKSTEAALLEDCNLIQYFLEYNINYDVPATRHQSQALLFKFLARIRESAHCLQRNAQQTLQKDKLLIHLEIYKKFLSWLTRFCFGNLSAGSNFSRRVCSLKLLSCILDTFKMNKVLELEEWNALIFTIENGMTLLSIVLTDTFEENKAIATFILKSFPPSAIGLLTNTNLKILHRSSLNMAASSHPSHSVSAAYILELCVSVSSSEQWMAFENTKCLTKEESLLQVIQSVKAQLEEELQRANLSLMEAASNGPMYGSLFCIRQLLKLIPDFRCLDEKAIWQDLIKNLVHLCLQISSTVSPIVNNSSPEGHLPMDFNAATNTSGTPFKATAQMVLLCAWRTVKEIALLFGELSDRCPILPDEHGILTEDQLLSIGYHLTKLLEETKHRGAFEQAYVGFGLLASRLWRHPKESLHSLPQQWLDEILNAIQSVEPTKTKLCATRRSAGIPFLVQALVTAELQTGSGPLSLQKTMKQLLVFAGDKEKPIDCRTHALNILRALFRHALLAEHITPFITDGFMVAITGFKGKSWAERNSATLLFSSLMTRVFGVRRSREGITLRNKMTGLMFFHRYPQLYGYLLTELEHAVLALKFHDTSELATLYPILLLLARLYPSSLEGTNSSMQLSKFVPWVQNCAGSTILRTRVAAAKAVVPLISAPLFKSHLDTLIDAILIEKQENMVHGLLLQAVQLFRSSSSLLDDQLENFSQDISKWLSKLLKNFSGKCSYPVLEVFLQGCEILAECWYSSVPLLVWDCVEELSLGALKLNDVSDLSNYPVCVSVCEARSARVLLQLSVRKKDISMECTVLQLLNHKSYEVVQETLLFLEHILNGSSSIQMDEEEESILFDVIEEPQFWVRRFPSDCISSMIPILYNSEKIGRKLASMVKSEYTLESRLALRALAQMAPTTWHQHINASLLILYCSSDHEASSCAALSCFSSLLSSTVNCSDNDSTWMEACCEEVPRLCSEERSVGCRTVAVNFLLTHKAALYRQYTFLNDKTVCKLWVIAIKLASDEDLNVRQTVTRLVSDVPLVTRSAVELLLKEFVDVMKHSSMCVATLIVLGLGSLPDLSSIEDSEERVFDKGVVNLFHEPEMLTSLVCKHLVPLSNENIEANSQANWIYSEVCGSESKTILCIRDLFKALRGLIYKERELYYSEYLIPPSIASFVHCILLTEKACFGNCEIEPLECLPYHFTKLIGE